MLHRTITVGGMFGDETMQNVLFDSYTEMTQGSFEAMRKISEINMRVSERLFQKQLDLTNVMMETGAKGLDVMSKAKGYQDLLSSEAKLAQEYGQECLKGYRDAIEALTEARDSMAEVMDHQMQTIAKNVQVAGETVKKAATKAAA